MTAEAEGFIGEANISNERLNYLEINIQYKTEEKDSPFVSLAFVPLLK